MNGSASEPSSATMNGTRWAIRPEMKATSRDSRSSFETITGHLAARAAASAVANWGRRSRASAPFACLRFDVFGDEVDLLDLCEPDDGGALGFDPEARAM